MAFYNCLYILRTEEVCNQPCYHPNGYKKYRNFRQVLCKEKKYDKMIRSK
jgi:hypothetical protein